MTPEETIRNLINRSSPRKGTGRILIENPEGVYGKHYTHDSQGKLVSLTQPAGPTQLSADELALKKEFQRIHGTDKSLADYQTWKSQQRKFEPASPEEVQKIKQEREQLKQQRMKLDTERPEGQPASFTPTGEAPKPGETSSGVKVPQPGTPEFAARRELERISAQRPPVDRSATQQPTPPQTQTEKPQADMAATSSSVPNPRMAGGGVQTGSGLNVSNIQAGQHSFTRQPLRASYDPMESRKNFIRESVILSLNETNLRKSQRRLRSIERKQAILGKIIQSFDPASWSKSLPYRYERGELNPQHAAAKDAVERAEESGRKRTNQREENAAVKDAERRAERVWER